MDNLNTKISMIRNEYELTQTEFAEKIGVSRGHVAALESGKYKPSKRLLIKIYKEFNIDAGVMSLEVADFSEEIKVLNPNHAWSSFPSKKELDLKQEITKQEEIITLLKENNEMLKEKIKNLENRIAELSNNNK